MKLFKPKFWDLEKANFISILLIPLSILIKFFVLIIKKTTKQNNFPISVICVGNIYLGGTGKTPLTIKIFKMLKNIGKKPIIIKKFYQNQYDEMDLIKANVNDYIFLKSRKDSIKSAFSKSYNVAVLDDGLQDFSIKKDISIVCFHENQLIGNGLTIPAGPLREDLKALENCQIAIINGEKNLEFEKKIRTISESIKIYYSKYIPLNIENFKNKNLLAFAGIGNPNNFFEIMEEYGLKILKKKFFPDHYAYSNFEIEQLVNEAAKDNLELITTEKDFHRIKKLGFTNIKYLPINTIIHEEEKLLNQIKFYLKNENN